MYKLTNSDWEAEKVLENKMKNLNTKELGIALSTPLKEIISNISTISC